MRADSVAGFAIWAAAVPEAFACASIAGLPAMAGLYALVPALVLYAVAGGSRQLVVGPTPMTAALTAAVVAPFAAAEGRAVAAALAAACGLAGIAAGMARLGCAASGIARPVRRGFAAGLAVLIAVEQAPALLGLRESPSESWREAWSVAGHLGLSDWRTVLLGGGCLLVLLVLQRWAPLVPAALVVAVAGVAAVRLLMWDGQVAMLSGLASGPPPIEIPEPGDVRAVLVPASAVLLIGFAEGLTLAETLAARGGYRISAHRELFGLGLANLGAALCSGMAVGGSPAQTAGLCGAGARTRLGGLVVAALAAVTMLTLTGMYEGLPAAVVAAIAIAAAIRLAEPAELRRLYRMWRERRGSIYGNAAGADFAATLLTVVSVVVAGVLPGLLIGLGGSILLLLYRFAQSRAAGPSGAARPAPDDRHLLIVPLGPILFFATANRLRRRILRQCTDHTRLLVLDAVACPVIDVTAARALGELSEDLAWRGIAVRLAGRATPDRTPSRQAWSGDGPITVYPSVAAALADGVR
ncbi:MFS superfamily sulfate permease-like transporter [Nocardia transvalensis]|uniref:MFS superfamily sulfate permease-like transporter n=1 Tax=Nocardia transvalensis TaxID=37333 RepID=A0A7W9PLB8_9NOCA|nr:SulP family inorganic anion transporter [Nocardia transvalensis]MBB5917773.1 MFS superfamily sulfate permease-like transporter [Nocardia transvalensis]